MDPAPDNPSPPSEPPPVDAGSGDPGRRRRAVLALLTVLVLVAAVAVRMRQSDDVVAAPLVTTTTTAPPPSTATSSTRPPRPTTTLPPEPVPPSSTVTALLPGKVPGYDNPGGAPSRVVDNLYYGFPTALSVIEEQEGWLHVRLPYKPNGSTTWIKKDKVKLDSTPWAIQIDVTRKRLKLFNAGQTVMDAPVGVGTSYTPTPLGDFFVTFLQKPENASYGPFVMITTGHSDVLQSFGGFPDGILGIHGPIGSDGIIGDSGAAISNGCIRMHVTDQVRLQQVTSGTPVHIYASPVPEPPAPE